ncbi:hypothetical protein [Arhodomonas aquaeolei]|uniref:hypothetical protein n=1 Tax=Arhodomonas aquaeolei TaxID=2369 RepID=UPI00036E6D29|nr:hypothetical protein [Arhodomonas aquaeolei]
MESSDAEALFGTDATPPSPTALRAGAFELTVDDGWLRHIRIGGREILRGIGLTIRDDQWGTCLLRREDTFEHRDDGTWVFRFEATTAGAGTLEAAFEARIRDRELTVTARLRSPGGFTTSRSGLVVLHPIEGIAGGPVTVVHTDGGHEEGRFPDRISPGQPFFDIAAIRHQPRPGITVECAFEGDVFEMEDQRNWTDASFKTYNRPLAWPTPYRIEAGDTVVQRVRVRIDGPAPGDAPAARRDRAVVPVHVDPNARSALPALGMGHDLGEPVSETARRTLAGIRPDHLHMRVDLRSPSAADHLRAAAALLDDVGVGAALDLGVILPDDAEPRAALQWLADTLEALGVVPSGVLALPAAYLRSYQPDGRWPETPTPDAVTEAVREVFPRAAAGGGMLTYFTELNRCPPRARIDFLSHATAAIVHAADDLSVMETLEALPHVFRSARAMAPAGTPYRVGMSAIGMWSNPYGVHTFDNRDRLRLPMARNDPRQTAQFAAAWNLGYYARARAAGVDAVALSSLDAPFATMDARGPYPVFHVLRGLARAPRARGLGTAIGDPQRVDAVAWTRTDGRAELWLANRRPETTPVRIEGFNVKEAQRLDATVAASAREARDWMDRTAAMAGPEATLPPYGVLRVIGTAPGEEV